MKIEIDLPDHMVTYLRQSTKHLTTRDLVNTNDHVAKIVANALPPEPLKVGDRVHLFSAQEDVGTILAIDGPMAWVRWDSPSRFHGERLTYILSMLRRA
jgi:hypothetical protein